MTSKLARIAQLIAAELKGANEIEAQFIDETLDALRDHSIKKCTYCGRYEAVSYSEGHDADLCDDCASETPERLVGDEIQYLVDGQWRGR